MSNLPLVTVDIETTGLDETQHEIVQIAVVPLTVHYEPNDELPIFYRLIRPTKRVDEVASSIHGIDMDALKMSPGAEEVAEDLRRWYDALGFPSGVSLFPLAHNWPFERQFLRTWLGHDEFNAIFHHRYRDSMVVAQYINDLALSMGQMAPYRYLSLSSLTQRLGVRNEKAHDALGDAVTCARTYRRLLEVSNCF